MPHIPQPVRKMDTNVFLTDWLVPFLILPNSESSFKPNYYTDRVVKILSVEPRAPDDGQYRVKDGLKVVICDSNHKAFGILTPEAISQYENEERVRITRQLVNMEILVRRYGVKFVGGSEARRYGYVEGRGGDREGGDGREGEAGEAGGASGEGGGGGDGGDGKEGEDELRTYATVVIREFKVFNRDRYMPRDAGMVEWVYRGRYWERYG